MNENELKTHLDAQHKDQTQLIMYRLDQVFEQCQKMERKIESRSKQIFESLTCLDRKVAVLQGKSEGVTHANTAALRRIVVIAAVISCFAGVVSAGAAWYSVQADVKVVQTNK